MSVDWDDYEPFDPGVWGPLREKPRRAARAAFDRLMAAKEARIEALRQLLRHNGVELGTSDDKIQELNDWFRCEVEADPRHSDRLLPMWYAVVNDVALFLGDVIIDREPNLRWEFFIWGAKNVSYQCHVIMGFTNVTDPKYNVDVDGLVATYGHRIIGGLDVREDEFLRWVKNF